MIIDTHTHLFDEAFNEDRTQAVSRAVNAGVEKMILPATDSASCLPMRDLCLNFNRNIFPAAGIHPEYACGNFKNAVDEILKFDFSKPICAVGEIGLDYFYQTDNVDIQKQMFEYQVNCALDLDLPIIIHCRNAYDDIFKILDKYKNNSRLRGVFHCFSSSADNALKILSYKRFLFGLGGIVTFKNSGKEICDIVKTVLKLQNIVLETDSPYIAPVPYRGRRNESSFITLTLYKLSELLDISPLELSKITSDNACEMFNI